MKIQNILIFLKILTFQILLSRIKNVVAQEICSTEGLICDINSKVNFCKLQDVVPLEQSTDIVTFKMSKFKSLNKIELTGLNDENAKYVNGIYDSDMEKFTLHPTEDFKNYAMKETGKTDFILKATFTCFHDQTKASEFTSIYSLKIIIDEKNLYPPEFSQAEYETKVSLPFIKGFDCIFLKTIKATDRDLKYNRITFSSNSEYFDVSTDSEREDNNHSSFAILTLKKPITEINERIEVEIKAEDDGNLSSTAKLFLIADKQKSLPIQPRFTNAAYQGNLTNPKEFEINAELDLVTYDDTIDFYLSAEDPDSKLFAITIESNKINIRLKDDEIDDEYIKDKSFLSFILNAKNPELQISGQTAIIVGLSNGISNEISFEKDLYRGKINEKNQLEIDLIKLLDKDNKTKYEFEIQGDDMNLFKYEISNEKELKLILKDDAIWDDKSYLYIGIVAKMIDIIKASTNVIINVPIIKNDFRFETPVFEGKINQTNHLEHLEIKFINEENLNQIDFKPIGENSDKFLVEISNNIALIKLKETQLPSEWSKKKFLSFQIQARKHNYDAIFASILINLPTKLQIPQFSEILYEGKIISKNEIDKLEIPVHNLGSQFRLSGGHNSFTINERNGIINISLVEPLTDEDLQLNYIALTLTAIFDEIDGSKSSTLIVLSTPISIIPPPITTTTESSGITTPTQETTTTTTEKPPDEKLPKFEKELYRFSIKSDLVGIFGDVKALPDDEISEDIEYSIGVVNDELKSRLIINKNGSLQLTAATSPGIYEFEVRAKFYGNKSYGKAFVILDVSPIQFCGDENSKVENALLIKHLEEERPHKAIIKAIEGNCHFEIISVSPNDKEYFILNDGNLDMISVDREDSIFAEMLVVQIQVKLILKDNTNQINEISTASSASTIEFSSESSTKPNNTERPNIEFSSDPSTEPNTTENPNIEFSSELSMEPNTTEIQNIAFSSQSPTEQTNIENIELSTQNYYKSFYNTSLISRSKRMIQQQFTDGKAYVLTESIKSSFKETTLTIIIEDINDNKPIFEYPPPDSEFIIGYPDVELSNNILPEYLLKVNATDLDIGLNALICYKLDNSDFGIDEETGIIYPYSDAMKKLNEIVLTVYAIDRKCEIEGSLNSSVEIIVKKIHSNQLVMLEFEGKQIEDVTKLLNEISKDKDIILRPLKWATVPSRDDKRKSVMSRIVSKIYGVFKVDNNQKTTLTVWTYAFNKENKNVIESKTIMEKLSGNSDIKAESYEDQVKRIVGDRDVTGFIVGIVILSIICAGCLAFIAWIFYFRKILYEKMSSSSRSEVSSFAASLETNSLENGKVSPPQISSYLKRESMKILGSTTQESSDYQTRMLELLNDRDQRDSVNSNGKNFNHNEDYSFHGSDNENIANGDIGERRKSVVKFNELVERIEIEDRRDSEMSRISSERL